MNEPNPSSFATLRTINVNDKIEKKGNLSYLSWAWAVDQLLQADPAASWEYRWFGEQPYCVINGTAMVFCTVTAFGLARTSQLPIMDSRNKSIPVERIDSFIVNTSMQRALAKAIALHGIGLYIYAGEDVPEGEQSEQQEAHEIPAGLLEAARNAADEGRETFAAYWKAIDPKSRKMLAGELDDLKARTEKAEKVAA